MRARDDLGASTASTTRARRRRGSRADRADARGRAELLTVLAASATTGSGSCAGTTRTGWSASRRIAMTATGGCAWRAATRAGRSPASRSAVPAERRRRNRSARERPGCAWWSARLSGRSRRRLRGDGLAPSAGRGVSHDAIAQVEALREPDARELAERTDLRDRAFVTIDPATARDHDDAVFVEPTRGGGGSGSRSRTSRVGSSRVRRSTARRCGVARACTSRIGRSRCCPSGCRATSVRCAGRSTGSCSRSRWSSTSAASAGARASRAP